MITLFPELVLDPAERADPADHLRQALPEVAEGIQAAATAPTPQD